MEIKGRILSIDYGVKRVGIAMTDEMQILATPVGTVENNKLFTKLKELLDAYNIVKVVIGYPATNDGNKNDIIEAIDSFILEFHKVFAIIPVKYDEAYSSIKARDYMNQSGKRKKYKAQKGNTDAFAAGVILQDYLNSI